MDQDQDLDLIKMDEPESEIKTEPEHDGDTDVPIRPKTPDSPENVAEVPLQENTTISPKKKPKMEIELDFSLVKSEYVPRKRKEVKRFDVTLLHEAEEKRRKLDKANYDKKISITDEDLFCQLCNQGFTELKAFKIHRQAKHSNVSSFTCALCSATFKTNKDLVNHKKVHLKEDRNFLCMKCKIAFSDHLEFLKHNAKHEKNMNFYCIECGKEFDGRTNYFVHIERHYYNVVKCDICNRDCQVHRIKEHIKSHKENGRNEKETCVECGKDFGKRFMMKHMTTHTGVRPFQCLYCGKGFSSRSSREIHTRIHTNEKPYECKICHQKFRQHADWKRHLQSHEMKNESNRLKCNVCKKLFKSKYTLAYHMDIHNNTMRYTCDICGFKVNSNTGLRNHVARVHSTLKLYECVPCGKSFKTASDICRHKKQIKHLNNMFGYKKKEFGNK